MNNVISWQVADKKRTRIDINEIDRFSSFSSGLVPPQAIIVLKKGTDTSEFMSLPWKGREGEFRTGPILENSVTEI